MTTGIDGWPIPHTSPAQAAWSGPSLDDLADFCRKYMPDPAPDRAVDADRIRTARDLADLLTGQLRKVHALAPDRPAGRQELKCAQDVATALGDLLPPSAPARGFDMLGSLGSLIDIPVIVSPDSARGSWRLVTHDGCEVRGADGDLAKAWVSHERCTMTAEGRLAE